MVAGLQKTLTSHGLIPMADLRKIAVCFSQTSPHRQTAGPGHFGNFAQGEYFSVPCDKVLSPSRGIRYGRDMKVGRIHRILRLITLLQSGRALSVDELAGMLEVSRRTVFRDLNVLEMAHIPYYFDRDRNGYRISRHYFLPPVNLTLTEALSLMLAGARRGSGSHLPWRRHAARAAMKLESALPVAVREHLGSVLEHIDVHPEPAARHEGLDATLDTLTEAITDRKSCRVVYISFHDQKQITLTVNPLRLTFIRRAWYLLGWSVKHKQVRTFKVGRIKRLTVLEKSFKPPQVDLESPFGQAWSMIPEGRLYDIRLRFDPMVAGNVAEVQWHPSQQVQWQADGSLEMTVQVDGLGEIAWWILGYGDKVRVIEPQELADRVAATAGRMAEMYDK